MTDVAAMIDQTMEQASRELVAMNYPTAERLCLAALAEARRTADWDRVARVLLPLQEARRQRRQIAADAGGFVLTGEKQSTEQIIAKHASGCLLLTDPPYSELDAIALRRAVREQGRYIEVLHADPALLAAICQKAMEDIGDAVLAQLDQNESPAAQMDELLRELDRVGDHELVHQQIATLARQALKEGNHEDTKARSHE